MNICYFIIAHKNPEQLHRLVKNLNDKGVSFFIHINKREENFYRLAVKQLSDFPNVYFTNRHKIWWGTFSILKATLSGLQEIAKSNITYDRVVLISGQDYPIKSNSYIRNFFSKNSDKNYIDYFALDSNNRWAEHEGAFNASSRIKKLYLGYRSRGIHLPTNRKPPYDFVGYGGIGWLNLTRECVEFISSFVENNHQFLNFFKYTYLPEEIFFSTLIMNSPLQSTVVNDDLRYVDWEKKNPTPPGILMLEDFDRILASPALFARKFDIIRDSEILDKIDREILESDSQSLSTPSLAHPSTINNDSYSKLDHLTHLSEVMAN